MNHRLANGMRLISTATLRPDGQTEWQLAIDNPTELEVAEIRFPVLTGVKLGDEAADDWMFEPKCWGQVWKHPAVQGPQTDWGPSMRWMALWDDSQGIFRGSPGSYQLWLKNLGTEPLTGTARVTGPAGLQVSCTAEVALPAEAEVTVPVQVDGQDQLREIGELAATLQVGQQQLELVRAVIPAVPNGNFEQDSAGDRKPDWWMCRKVGDDWAYERMHLAEGAHSGKSCLQLDAPQGDEKFLCAYPVHSVVKPNTRYRVSIWIKAASKDGVSANLLGKQLGQGQTGPEWQQFTAEVTTGAELSGLYRTL